MTINQADIQKKLGILLGYRQAKEKLELDRLQLIHDLTPKIPDDVQKQIDDVNSEFSGKESVADSNINRLEEEIKLLIVDYGQTVKANGLMGIFNKGRIKWNTDRLNAYAKKHKEVLDMQEQGEPYVSFRKVESE
jgi:hypothetical protein